MTTTLVTGGNKGLGRETARRLAEAGHDVWIGARDEGRGAPAAEELGVRFVQLDVTDDASVAAAAATVGSLDVLVNNAGMAGRSTPTAETSLADLREVFEVNVLGAVRVLGAFLPLLQRSSSPVVVNVSSGLGSVSGSTPGGPYADYPSAVYPASKAALNMLTVRYAAALPGLRINSANPGYTATDLNANEGTQSVEEGAEVIVRLARLGPDGPTGGFFNRDGPDLW